MMKSLIAVCLLVATVTAKYHYVEPLTDDMVNYINKLDTTWTAGHNSYFAGKDIKFAKSLCGVLFDPTRPKLPEQSLHGNVEDIPTAFDARTKWPSCATIGEVRDQSDCGSCWAFGAVEAMSDRYCIASNGTVTPHISGEDLLSCCRICGMGCNGGFPSAAWSYWKNTGLVTGGQYGTKQGCRPYTLPHCDHHTTGKYQPCSKDVLPTPPCKKECEAGYNKTYSQDKHYGSSAYSVPSAVSKIQTEIMTYGPIEVAFTVYEDFLSYKSGVYQHKTGSELGGHAVKMLGWGVDGTTPFWIIANSWNEDWGMKGFFNILRGDDECGIESQGTAGLPKL